MGLPISDSIAKLIQQRAANMAKFPKFKVPDHLLTSKMNPVMGEMKKVANRYLEKIASILSKQ